MAIDVSDTLGGVSAAALTFFASCAALATSNLSWLIQPILDESHSDPLVIQITSSNAPPIHIGFGMFVAFSRILFHR